MGEWVAGSWSVVRSSLELSLVICHWSLVEIVEERSLGRGFGTIILNGCTIEWLYGSGYGTTGKDTKLDITNQKECSKPVLLITRIRLTLLPISPSPHYSRLEYAE
jgi:hypothetical protein